MAEHLGLLDAPDASAYNSAFQVTGFDGKTKHSLPILQAWMRMGTRGDQLRWELMHLTVLNSPTYKLILGIDYLKRRKGRLDMERMALTLCRDNITYTLPLKDKRYAMNAPSIKAF